MPRPYDQTCPIARTLDLIGDRWTLLIVRDMFMEQSRFNQFLQQSPGLPPKILSDRLKKLEAHGLIQRRLYSQHPLRAEYHLTDRGRTLAPIIEALLAWGIDNCFDPDQERDLLGMVRARLSELQLSPSG
jgi:DNA-binding HxlR family transcriptional regulator